MDLSTTAMEIKTKLDKPGHIKLKSFRGATEAINKMKRQSREWEKTFAKNETDKGLISKMYKENQHHNMDIKK